MRMIVTGTLCACFLLTSLPAAEFAARRDFNWHQWRGPRANGVAPHGDPPLEWDERPSICVVMASEGYPGDYEKGREITGLDNADQVEDVKVFRAGTQLDGDRFAIGDRQHTGFLADQFLFDDQFVARFTELPPRCDPVDRLERLLAGAADDHALAGRQPIRLDHHGHRIAG